MGTSSMTARRGCSSWRTLGAAVATAAAAQEQGWSPCLALQTKPPGHRLERPTWPKVCRWFAKQIMAALQAPEGENRARRMPRRRRQKGEPPGT